MHGPWPTVSLNPPPCSCSFPWLNYRRARGSSPARTTFYSDLNKLVDFVYGIYDDGRSKSKSSKGVEERQKKRGGTTTRTVGVLSPSSDLARLLHLLTLWPLPCLCTRVRWVYIYCTSSALDPIQLPTTSILNLSFLSLIFWIFWIFFLLSIWSSSFSFSAAEQSIPSQR